MGHATYEWIYVAVVVALLTWVGADAWNTEHKLEDYSSSGTSYQSYRSAMVLDL